MILGYKQYYPFNKQWTNFEAKILASFPVGYLRKHARIISEGMDEKSRDAYITLFLDGMKTAAPKLHTIREDSTNRWKAGMLINHAFGVRTKGYRCFAKNQCLSTQTIQIEEMAMISASYCYVVVGHSDRLDETFSKIFRVAVDGRNLTTEEIQTLARNDGFDSTEDFFRWFNGNWKGKIIHWTDLKY